jgi:hypothetical protein
MEPIPFRLRLGLIGHRTLATPDKLTQAVRELLRESLFSDLGLEASDTPIQLAAVTSLADGADRLLAGVVLEQPEARLEVILPFAVELFRATLNSDGDRKEFDAMLKRDRSPRVLRQETQPSDQTERELAYRDGARELLNNCDVLIAIWDGHPAKGPGGTGETVEIARRRGRPLYIVSPDGVVRFERRSGVDREALEGMRAFNNAPEPGARFLKTVETSELGFLQPGEKGPVPEPHREAIQSILVPAYLRASLLAKKNQGIYLMAGRLIYIFAPIAVLCVAAAATLAHEFEHTLFVCEAALLVVVLILFVGGEAGRFQEKWMTNRFLSERLRAGFFLGACGLEPLPIDVPPHLGLAHRPADWPVRAFNEIWLRMPALVRCAEEGCEELVAFVRKHWIEDQIEFHESRARRWGSGARLFERAGIALFALTILVAFAHLGLHPDETWSERLTVLAIGLPAFGGAAAAYRGYRGFERLEKRSEQMVESLKDLNQRLATVRTASQLQQRMREMETLSLRETQDWLMLVRFTHLEPA